MDPINIPPMLAYIPYMDPMGYVYSYSRSTRIYIYIIIAYNILLFHYIIYYLDYNLILYRLLSDKIV